MSRDERRATVDSELSHSVEPTSSWHTSPSSSFSSSALSPASSAAGRVTLGGRCADRRRAATERERQRLRRVNDAFDALRARTCHHVTCHTVTRRPVRGHRLSKLDILRRTISYIEYLERLLNDAVHVTRYRNVPKTNTVSRYNFTGNSIAVD